MDCDLIKIEFNDWLTIRVVVSDTVSVDMVSVYFCDFGDMAPLETCALRPVPAAVPLARTLPPQAIRAKLHGNRAASRTYWYIK